MLLRQVRGHAHVPAAIAAAAAAIRGPQQAAYEEAGFTRRSVRMPSGEEVSYLSRRSTTDPPERCVVFLHGMTSDALGSAAAVVPIASRQPPGVRILVPDAAGHGKRHAWAVRSSWEGLSLDDHMSDVEAFCAAVGASDGTVPVDLVGYSMGGATAFALAARHVNGSAPAASRLPVRRVALLAPALLVTQELYAMTLSVQRHGGVERCVYNYRTEAEAEEMLRLVGYAEPLCEKLAPVLAWGRRDQPPDFWWKMWRGLGGVQAFGEGEVDAAVDAKRAALASSGSVLAEAATPVLVVQGSAELVVDASVPREVRRAVGSACDVATLEGFGHRGHPTDASKDFLTAAGQVVGPWLGR